MDPIERLADIVIHTSYEDIPVRARDTAKRSVVDTLAALIGGSTVRGCGTVAQMVAEWGGREESTVLVYGKKVPSSNAVWANATMGRALDFDDVYAGPGSDHTGTTTVTTALAVSELLGKISGKEVIAAIALGVDLILSIRKVSQVKVGSYPWASHATSALTAAAVAGKLMKLNRKTLVNALGIAFSQVSGTLQSLQDGAMANRVHHGLMARSGVLSALMAEREITGPHNILEGKYGFYPVFFQNQYDRQALMAGIERGFQNLICEVSIKPYPGCAFNHPPIEAALRLSKEHDIRPENVASITVYTNQPAYDVCYFPEDRKKRPKTVVDAQFSIPYTVAHALVYGDVFIDAFSEERLKDPTLLSIASKVKVVVDQELNARAETHVPIREEIRTLDGGNYRTSVEHAKGHPGNPMSFEDCVRKLMRCLAFSAKPLPVSKVEQAVGMIHELEKVDDVGKIPELLIGE